MLCLASMVSCKSGQNKVLESAANIVNERPDSAYVLLKKVDLNSLSNGKDKALYALTHAKANMYMGRSLVTDTIIPTAVSFLRLKATLWLILNRLLLKHIICGQ